MCQSSCVFLTKLFHLYARNDRIYGRIYTLVYYNKRSEIKGEEKTNGQSFKKNN
jgi:hypothetical protein